MHVYRNTYYRYAFIDAVVIHTLAIELKIVDTLVMISLVMYPVVLNVLDIDTQAAWMLRMCRL